jgi:endoglucanase
MKFGFPMASTATLLAWGFLEYADGFAAAGQTTDFLRTLRWFTDYFIKCHVSPNELYVQVGNVKADHNWWGRAEDMTMARPAYKVTPSSPGSDVAGETAAALAAASLVFASSDARYSAQLLMHARQLHKFANTSVGIYSVRVNTEGSYESDMFQDELVWAEAWLYRATRERSYLDSAASRWQVRGEVVCCLSVCVFLAMCCNSGFTCAVVLT